VACTEVSVNRVTGETKILRNDLLMDLGRPINKDLDLGQVTGAFVQGAGWLTLEKLSYSKEGALLSVGPSTYKIPAIHDIPREWTVDLLENTGNLKNLRGTKAVGEPPLLLGISVWTAIQNALSYEKRYQDRDRFPILNVPADSEAIIRTLYPAEYARLEKL
jgi:xanthine dehydrogenase large subunit